MSGAPELSLLDDDTIQDAGGNPLGGVGAGNGAFSFNGEFDFYDLPAPADDDFEGSMLFIAQSAQPYESLLGGFSFSPDVFDSNGHLSLLEIIALIENYEEGEPLQIPGNGILEVAEFAVIERLLHDPPNLTWSLDLGGAEPEVVDAGAHTAAVWANNIAQMQTDLGGEDGLAAIILPGLDTFLAGLLTLGDENSELLVTTLAGPIGLGNPDLQEQFPINVTPPIISNYMLFPEVYSWEGDPDGDGFNNAEEYVYFACDGIAAYADAALDPKQYPVTPGGFYEAGDSVRMAVWPEATEPPAYFPHHIDRDAVYQWYRNDTALTDGGALSGANDRVLNILSLTEADSGAYRCIYDEDDAKAPVVYGPIQITVAAELPLAGGIGLAALALLTGLAGGIAARKRR